MPPVNQGSRAALVVWTVITSFLFIVATIFAIYFYVDADSSRKTAANQSRKYNEVVREAELSSGDIAALNEAKTSDPSLNPSMTAMQVALTQRDNLAKKIAGSTADNPAAAAAAANTAVARAAERLKIDAKTLPADNLIETITTLTNTLAARQQEVTTLNSQVADLQKKQESLVKDTQAQIEQMTKTMEQIRAEQQQAIANVSSVTAEKDTQIQTVSGDAERQLAALRDQIQSLQTANAELGGQNRALTTELNRIRERLSEVRIDPTQAVTRVPDGRIIRVERNNTVYIDLGGGDQVTSGLTFEVFDKGEGIPRPGDANNEENLPQGKASIEVIRVSPSTSECRVTRTTPGTTLSEGDLIVNLVYDRNTKYNFVVYGNFDLDRNGVATPQDAEVVKRLVTQWGGNVVPDINVDTDFVVLGREPEIPTATRDELANDPILKARYDAAVAESEAYSQISAKAREYRIPILNQNRFLYLIGYYNQAQR
jgi:predicted  nucleic acid-binding Zn-ribbon protein